MLEASWIFHSGAVFDGRRLLPQGSAVAVAGGTILAVGPEQRIRALAGPGTETVDLGGRLISPGFTDAHVHAAYAGVERLGCDLAELQGARACLDRIADAAARPPAPGDRSAWITGGGWYKGDFPGGYPDRVLLDSVTAGRPAYLINRDHHSAWVNTRALELAGVDASTPDPADGRLERDADGFPTGTLHEGAMDLVARVLPPVTDDQLAAGLLAAQQHLFSMGVTGWQEAILGDYGGYPDASGAYRSLISSGRLTARATGALWVPRSTTVDSAPALAAAFCERRRLNAAAGFPTRSAKIMVDGVPENCTAAMLDPYLRPCSCGGPAHEQGEEERGLLYLSPEVLDTVSAELAAAGFDLHLHVIGDRAVRTGLDAVAAARAARPAADARHHMAHLQIIHPDDVARFAALDVTVNAQALWACNDDQMRELTVPLIGAERAAWQYPFAGLQAAGARLAMGSDWPVSSPDPWQAIHVAVNRSHPDYPGADPLLPEQALTLTASLAAYTSGSAWLNRSPAGSLEPGAAADLTVHSANPFDLPATELHTLAAQMVLVGGQPVYSRASSPAPAPSPSSSASPAPSPASFPVSR